MTRPERQLAERLQSEEGGGYLVKNYIAPNGIRYCRLRSDDHRPLCNIRYSVYEKLQNRGVVEGGTASQPLFDIQKLKELYAQWRERKKKRDERKKNARNRDLISG